jgi:GNAT superfamily N-acetyltransferase
MLRDASLARLTVHWLGVVEDYRQRGIGRRLLAAAEGWAVSRGAQVAGFNTDLGARSAVPFYERLGYVQQAVYLRKRLGRLGDP